MSKHTPGSIYEHSPAPWHVLDDDIRGYDWSGLIRTSNGVCAAIDCTGSGLSREQDLANAHLIAAAPDLLAALEEFEIVRCHDCRGDGLSPYNRDDACRLCGGTGDLLRGGHPGSIRAAIAKAYGQPAPTL